MARALLSAEINGIQYIRRAFRGEFFSRERKGQSWKWPFDQPVRTPHRKWTRFARGSRSCAYFWLTCLVTIRGTRFCDQGQALTWPSLRNLNESQISEPITALPFKQAMMHRENQEGGRLDVHAKHDKDHLLIMLSAKCCTGHSVLNRQGPLFGFCVKPFRSGGRNGGNRGAPSLSRRVTKCTALDNKSHTYIHTYNEVQQTRRCHPNNMSGDIFFLVLNGYWKRAQTGAGHRLTMVHQTDPKWPTVRGIIAGERVPPSAPLKWVSLFGVNDRSCSLITLSLGKTFLISCVTFWSIPV